MSGATPAKEGHKRIEDATQRIPNTEISPAEKTEAQQFNDSAKQRGDEMKMGSEPMRGERREPLRVSPGRIVHYVLANGEVRPMIVIKVWNDQATVSGTVFHDGSADAATDPHGSHKTDVAFSAESKPNTWHWPPRLL